jgi:uncharacterized protein (DUF1697 family)
MEDVYYEVISKNGHVFFEQVEESPQIEGELELVIKEYWGFGKGCLLGSRFSVDNYEKVIECMNFTLRYLKI